jgi:hypothetical protein
MGNCDDSIAEIDAMIPRLLKMKKQLAAQKEYIEVALKDANDSGNSNANTARTNGSTAKIVDFRANLYKHQQKIQRLDLASTDGSLGTDIETGSTTVSNIDITRAKKNGGGSGDIFTSSQKSVDGITTQETLTNTNIFDGVDLVGAKKFLIGINSILTQSNDISTNATSKEAIIPYSSVPVDVGKFSPDYVAGGTHTVNEEILRGLIMHGNDREKNTLDISEENGIFLREVAGEEIVIDETFAQITSRPTNMTDNSTGWLIPDQNNALTCNPAATTNLKPTLIVSNNKLLKVKVEKDNIGSGHQTDDVFTVSKEHIPGTSDMTGNIYTTIGTNINDTHSDGFYKIISGISRDTGSGNGMNILIQIASNVVSKIIIIAGSGYQTGEVITVTQAAINGATLGSSSNDLVFTLTSNPGNYNRFVYDSLTITATGASDGISQISESDITGTGSNMSIIATIDTAVITDIVIISEGGDIRGYQTNETISISDTALTGSSSIGDFTLTKCPSCSDIDLVLNLIKVPGATNTTATANRGKKIRGFGL